MVKSVMISVVIPTRNRLSLVKEALVSVQCQTYSNWECVVFDNGSDEPLGEYVHSLRDDRIVYSRSDTFLPVTDSWNRAIDLATGDYVILIGDDDGLTPQALQTIVGLIEQFGSPDIFYSALFVFFHPGVAPWEPAGFVDKLKSGFFSVGRSAPFVLEPAQANLAVRGSLEFRRSFAYNMQAFFFRRSFLDRIRSNGSVYRSPFPDYYLANVALVRSNSTVIVPEPITVQGVSRKSFGFTLFNNLPERGASLLATDLERDPLYPVLQRFFLPGPPYHVNFALTMAHVEDYLGSESPAKLNIERFRRLQIFSGLGGEHGLRSSRGQAPDYFVEQLLPLLTDEERTWAENVMALAETAGKVEQSSALLSRIASAVAMYAPHDWVQRVERVCTGRFASLPELLMATRTGALIVD